MEKRDLRTERLAALPMRYETSFIFVHGVNIALVSQSNTNVQLTTTSLGAFNLASQGNLSSVSQH